MNPVVAIAHVIAIALGVFGGFWVVDAIAPDLPDADVEAGVAVPVDLKGGDSDSLFNPGPLSAAFAQIDEQTAANVEFIGVTITPDAVETRPVGAFPGSFALSEVTVTEPMRVIDALAGERAAITADLVKVMELIATPDGEKWLVQLVSDDPELSPPWQYVVPLGSGEVQAGGPLPEPFEP